MDISVGIPTYNSKNYLRDCLISIKRGMKKFEYEIIVVDDGDDDTGDMVREEFPEVKYFKNERRRGAAFNTNVAIKNSSGKYFLRLDSDTEIIEGSVDKLLLFLREHPNAGAVGAGIINKRGISQKNTHTGRFSPYYWFKEYNFLISKLLARIADILVSDSDEPIKVYGMGAAAVLVRKKVLDQGILLDPKIPFFMEDSDWFVRMQKVGWEVWHLPSAKVYHYGGISSGDYYIHMTDVALGSLYRFYEKHFPQKGYGQRLTRAILLGVVINLLITLFLYLPSRFHGWTRRVIDKSLRSSVNVILWHIKRAG